MNIAFDLDGTLIDSADAILAALAAAFAACAVVPQQALSPRLIGPPLMTMLARLAGEHQAHALPALAAAFKQHYDDSAYRQTRVFAGVSELLQALGQRGDTLFIATNKRILPTRRIIDHLGWQAHFAATLALDAFSPPLSDKAELLARLLQLHGLQAGATLYVGDLHEDGLAARAAGMPFRLVSWGYGAAPSEWRSLASPQDLLRELW